MRKWIAMGAAALGLVLGGCASTPQITLKPEFWQQRDAGIGVMLEEVPKMGMYALGGQGLLDVAIMRGSNSALIDKLEATKTERFSQMPSNVAKQLQSRGFNVTVFDKPVDVSKLPDFKGDAATQPNKDFRGLKRPGVDRLMVMQVTRSGIQRGYYGFIPLGAPTTTVIIKGYIVDLGTNTYLWNHIETGSDPITEPWDAPPEFTNLFTAVKQTGERVSSTFERALFAPPKN